jgi:hypothetical protein
MLRIHADDDDAPYDQAPKQKLICPIGTFFDQQDGADDEGLDLFAPAANE